MGNENNYDVTVGGPPADAAEAMRMQLLKAHMEGQMRSSLMGGQPTKNIQSLPYGVQEHLSAAADSLGVGLVQIVPFNSTEIRLELNGVYIPRPNTDNALLCEGFLKGKKGAKASAVAERLADDEVFACDPAEDVRQAENWLRAIYEMETGEEL